MPRLRRAVLLSLALNLLALPALAQVVVATVPVGQSPVAAAVNPVTNKIYVGDLVSSDVTVIDGTTDQTTTIVVGALPIQVAVNPVTNKIYVVNQGDNTLTVIDGITSNTTTVSIGLSAFGIAVNPVTNKIYVANYCGNDPNCASPGTVTVIDGVTNQTTTVTVGGGPNQIAVNPVTNKIYVANYCGNSTPQNCSGGTVTVIDGVTNNTSAITVGNAPLGIGVNSVTNRIYVGNESSNTVTVIDGISDNVSTVNVGNDPIAIAINPITNRIYVANRAGNSVTVIDGGSDSATPVAVGQQPVAIDVDSVTNKIYVVDKGDNTVTMIDGATNNTVTVGVGTDPEAIAINRSTNRIYIANRHDNTVSVIAGANAAPLQFVAVEPCRVYDTRPHYGGSGPIPGGTTRTFNLPLLAQAKVCASLATAAAYSLNITVVPQGYLGYLITWPTGEDRPAVSTLNSLDGRIKANAAIVPAGAGGSISVYVANTTDVILDIDGYFSPVSTSTLAFYPLPPCRVADTRKSLPNGLGTPNLSGGAPRDFSVLLSTCNIPITAQAYSLNFTVVPYPTFGYPLGYLEVWPTGPMPRHPVSTLNNLTGTIVANAAIVPAGGGGDITALARNNTDLVIDIDGYFAPAGPGGLSLYPVAPCRVIDTRLNHGQPFSGTLSPPVDVVDSPCEPPAAAQAYVFNATVVPQGGLGYLTLWPDDGSMRPTASTLNAIDGWIASNMAILPTTNGSVNAYASGITQLILDISSYFAP